jgi:hypothetical protein
MVVERSVRMAKHAIHDYITGRNTQDPCSLFESALKSDLKSDLESDSDSNSKSDSKSALKWNPPSNPTLSGVGQGWISEDKVRLALRRTKTRLI